MDMFLAFLSFDILISRHALIVFYYLGALGMPLAAWVLARYLLYRYAVLQDAMQAGKGLWVALFQRRQRWLAIALFIAAFLFMELLWRMMFEYLIAFMQMRDALVKA